MEWEHIHTDDDQDGNLEAYTERLKVPGGWLYRVRVWNLGVQSGAAICFVPGRADD
jgi:hypothetical protein